jgi:molybdenum cofactor biosynthesis enzyme MoaA
LANKIKELKDAGITRINISIYPENFEILKSSLPEINKIYQVHTSYVLTKTMLENNQQYIFDVVDFSIASGCKSLRFWMYRSLGKIQSLDEIITEDSSAYKEFKTRAMEKYKNFVLFPQVVSNSKEKKCTQLWQRVNITPNGLLCPCCGNGNYIQNANLFSNNIEELYNCGQIVEMRKNLLDNSIPPLEMCKNCNLLTETGW